MAFPTTGLLDNFNRADADSLGADWMLSGLNYAWTRAGEIKSNQAGADDSGDSDSNDWYDASTFGPDCEIHYDVIGGDYFELELRLVTPATTGVDGYVVSVSRGATPDAWDFFRVDNGASTKLGATVSQNVANGDSIGAEMIGSTLTAYLKPSGGSWGAVGNRSDGTHGGAGYLGTYLSPEATALIDNFSGGTVVAAPAPSAYRPALRALLGVGR